MSTIAVRLAWTQYATEEMLGIQQMSSEERTQSIDQLRSSCVLKDHGLPTEEVQSILQYPGGMTEKELKARAVMQSLCEKLSASVLQADFTHFYKKDLIMKRLAVVATSDSSPVVPKYIERANRLIIDEIGKSLLRNGIQPQVPQAAAGQKA